MVEFAFYFLCILFGKTCVMLQSLMECDDPIYTTFSSYSWVSTVLSFILISIYILTLSFFFAGQQQLSDSPDG